jgi:predicted phage terminase large subunit-like protein
VRLKAIARSSPAGLAAVVTVGAWKLAPHLKLLNEKLLQVATGRCPRLAVFMPPRHGKSELISRFFPAWFLGTAPDKRVLFSSYEADFAAQWGRKVRDVLEDKGPEVFGISIRRDSSAADRWEIDGRKGGMQTCGIGGPLTGKGADVLIIDDPVKNAEEANSEAIRERNWDWYRAAAYTRLEPGGAVVVIQTRWHESDLAGRILAHAREIDEPWDVLSLPALSEGPGDPLGRSDGEPLWPERFDRSQLMGIRKTLGSYFWHALYQQNPQPAEGGAFKRSWIRNWREEGELYLIEYPDRWRAVAKKHCRRFGVVDLAWTLKKENDYFACLACAVTPQQDLLLLDLHRERLEGPDIVPAIERMIRKWDLNYIGVEDAQAQLMVIQHLRKRGHTVRALRAEKDKLSRAIPATIRMEAGQVFLPETAYWLDDFVAELLAFPHGTHDDQVDVLAYAAVEVQRFGGAGEPESYDQYREYAEKELAAEWFNRVENPVLWVGDDD